MKNPLLKILKNLKEEKLFPTDEEIKLAIEKLQLISITPKKLKQNLQLLAITKGI